MVDITHFTPRDSLKKYIESFVFSKFDFSKEPFTDILIPDGHNELYIQNSSFTEYKIDAGGFTRPGKYFMTGQMKNAVMARYGSGFRYVVRFHPWGAHYFLDAPMSLFTGKMVGIEKAFGRAARRVCDQVIEAAGSESAVELLQDLFEKKITPGVSAETRNDENIIDMVKNIIDSKCITKVMEIMDSSYFGNRHLLRKFNKIIGLNPKTFIKIMRLNLCIGNIRSEKVVNTDNLLEEYGYYDRSHMVREFKDILKLTPGSCLEECLRLVGVLIGDAPDGPR